VVDVHDALGAQPGSGLPLALVAGRDKYRIRWTMRTLGVGIATITSEFAATMRLKVKKKVYRNEDKDGVE
jgi:hypothetical protein